MIRPHLAGYAALVGVLTRDHHFRFNGTDFLDGLDALADLMIEHAERRRELARAETDAWDTARTAYQDGRDDGRELALDRIP